MCKGVLYMWSFIKIISQIIQIILMIILYLHVDFILLIIKQTQTNMANNLGLNSYYIIHINSVLNAKTNLSNQEHDLDIRTHSYQILRLSFDYTTCRIVPFMNILHMTFLKSSMFMWFCILCKNAIFTPKYWFYFFTFFVYLLSKLT